MSREHGTWERDGETGFKIPVDAFIGSVYERDGWLFMTHIYTGEKSFKILHPDGHIHRFSSEGIKKPTALKFNLDEEGSIDSYEWEDPK